MADQFIQKPGDAPVKLAESEFKTLQDAANKGFSPVQTPTPEPVVDAGTLNESTVEMASKAPELTEANNQKQLSTERVMKAFESAGPEAKANEAFIQAAAQARFGRPATAEELGETGTEFGLVGSTTKDVLGRFGLLEQSPTLGVEEPKLTDEFGDQRPGLVGEEPAAPTVEEPKSAQQKIADLLGGAGSVISSARARGRDEFGVEQRAQELADAQSFANEARTALQNLGIIQIKEQDALTSQPIPNSIINRQLAGLSREQKLDAMISQNNYNNALVEAQIAQGNLNLARELSSEVADDILENLQFQLDSLEVEGKIEEAEAERLNQQLVAERDLAKDGFVEVKNPQDFSDSDIFVDPISGKSYLRPSADPVEAQLAQLDILSKKLGIEKQLLENELIGDDSFQTTVTTGDGMFRVTYDKSGNEVNRSRIGDSPAGTKNPTSSQFIAKGFADRIEQSEAVLLSLAGVGTGVGEAIGARMLPELFKTENRKRFEQAERNFINAQLRRESGAAIADSEFDSARKQYIPQPGDGDKTLKQKKINREIVLKNLQLEAGPAISLAGSVSGGGVSNTEDLFN